MGLHTHTHTHTHTLTNSHTHTHTHTTPKLQMCKPDFITTSDLPDPAWGYTHSNTLQSTGLLHWAKTQLGENLKKNL